MGRAIMSAVVSLDGFIAYDDDTVGPLSTGSATATSRPVRSAARRCASASSTRSS